MIKTRSGSEVTLLERTDHPGWFLARFVDIDGETRERELSFSELYGSTEEILAALDKLPAPETRKRKVLSLSDGEHFMLSRVMCGKEYRYPQLRPDRKTTVVRLQKRCMLTIEMPDGQLKVTEFGRRVLAALSALAALAVEESVYVEHGWPLQVEPEAPKEEPPAPPTDGYFGPWPAGVDPFVDPFEQQPGTDLATVDGQTGGIVFHEAQLRDAIELVESMAKMIREEREEKKQEGGQDNG